MNQKPKEPFRPSAKQHIKSDVYDRAFVVAEFNDMIDEMWIDKEGSKHDVGWNCALAELEARLKIKSKL